MESTNEQELKAIAQKYYNELRNLRSNSKLIINSLTIMAEAYLNIKTAYGRMIATGIKMHLAKASHELKLPILYLIDSIVKNVKKDYVDFFSRNFVTTIMDVFKNVCNRTRGEMLILRRTWNNIFPARKLYAIDVKAHELDSRWPIAKITANLDLNELRLTEQLLIKQKELMQLSQKKLELELAQTKAQAEVEKQESRKRINAQLLEEEQIVKTRRLEELERDTKTKLHEEFIQAIKNDIMKRRRIPKEVSLTKIKTMIEADYELTDGCNYISIPMYCPLTTQRLTTPVKYSTCSHLHCFELEAFIRLAWTTTSANFSSTKCPICSAEVDFKDLAVDELFITILQCGDKKNGNKIDSSGDKLCEVKIYKNGEWEWEGSNWSEKEIENIVLDSEDSEVPSPASGNLDSAASGNSNPEIIDSDDEDVGKRVRKHDDEQDDDDDVDSWNCHPIIITLDDDEDDDD